MKINWLWDSRLSEEEVKKVLKDENNPRFNIYLRKLLSRASDPQMVFNLVERVLFCKRWPVVKKQMQKNKWLDSKVVFWQTIYQRVYKRLKERGIKVRQHEDKEISLDREKVAEQIKDIRIKLGYSQKDLANKLGVVQQYISKIENGRENISIDSLKKIANVLGKKVIIKLS